MKNVLMIATEGDQHDVLFSALGDKTGLDGDISLTSATCVRDAEVQFRANPDFDAIVIAAGNDAEVLPMARLVRGFRTAGFEGPMIAAGMKDHRRELVRAGCKYQATWRALPGKLIEVLGL